MKITPLNTVVVLLATFYLSGTSCNFSDTYADTFRSSKENSVSSNLASNTSSNGAPLSTPQMQKIIQLYAGWNQFLISFSQINIQSCNQAIQMNNQIMQNSNAQMQQMSYSGDPIMDQMYHQGAQLNQQMNATNQQQIQQANIILKWSQYGYQLAMQNYQLMQQFVQQPNEQLFAQISALHAVGMYQIFGKGNMKSYEQCVFEACQWMLSQQYQSDINNGIAYLAAQNKANRAMAQNFYSPTSILQEDRHRTRFSDILLGQNRFIDPQNGNQFITDQQVNGLTIDGRDLEEY